MTSQHRQFMSASASAHTSLAATLAIFASAMLVSLVAPRIGFSLTCCALVPYLKPEFPDLIPLLADRFHIIAPDLPGFGQSDMPARGKFKYTFDNIAGVIDRFTEVVGLDRFAVYVFDYGAPTGFRIAMKHPDRITAIISQNGNAYEEGLSAGVAVTAGARWCLGAH
jgi:pimeloyl-ACP methyl ester carboxylesterase